MFSTRGCRYHQITTKLAPGQFLFFVQTSYLLTSRWRFNGFSEKCVLLSVGYQYCALSMVSVPKHFWNVDEGSKGTEWLLMISNRIDISFISVCNIDQCARCSEDPYDCEECSLGYDLIGSRCMGPYRCLDDVEHCVEDGCEEHDHTRCRVNSCVDGYHSNNGICTEGIYALQCGFKRDSLWSSDAIWRQGSRSTLVQVITCCLTAPSHYLN